MDMIDDSGSSGSSGPAEEGSLIDRSIAELRRRPLSEEEMDAISSRPGMKMPSIYPAFFVKEIKVDGKIRAVPFIGIKGTF